MARRVLDQVARADPVREELPYHIELVVPRKDLHRFFLACLFVLFLDDLRVVLNDVGQSARRKDVLP